MAEYMGRDSDIQKRLYMESRGMKINIREDCWIPNSFSRKIITPGGNRILSKVNELIDPIWVVG